jgi:hypothetical protein
MSESVSVTDQVAHSYKTGKLIVLIIVSLGPYVLDGQVIVVRFPSGVRVFSLIHNIQTGPGAHPTSYTMTTEVCFPGIKEQGYEGDNSSPSSAEVYFHSPIRLQSAVLSELNKGVTLP